MNSTAQEIEQPRFNLDADPLEWILQYCFIAEAAKGDPSQLNLYFTKDTEKKNDFQLFMARARGGLTQAEFIADGIMLKNTLMRQLDSTTGRTGRWVIGAKYRKPSDNTLHYMKRSDYKSLADEIKRINRRIVDRWFIIDVIRGYMEGGDMMHKSMEEWARKIGTSDKTVYRWAGSREPGYKSIKYMLNLWESEANYYITKKLIDEGVAR